MYNDNWSAKFIKDKLSDFESVVEINIISENLAQLIRKEGIPFKAFTMSKEYISINEIKEICGANLDLNFIVNIKSQYSISGETLDYLSKKNVSFGGLGDLMRFCNKKDNIKLVDKEFEFVFRGLDQHDKVSDVERLDNRRLQISRFGLPDVIAIMINDYDITAESVRNARSFFGEFRVIIKTNPNGKITDEAATVGKLLNVDICKWGTLLGKLNSQWT